MYVLLTGLILAMGLNILMSIPAYLLKTDKLTDISYGLSFIAVALLIFFGNTITFAKFLLLLMIVIWSIRIGYFLFLRIRKIKRDKRFDGIRENFLKFFGFWLLQGFTVWMVLLPSILYFNGSGDTFSAFSIIGIAFWMVGLTFETIADIQKYRFANNPINAGKWIDEGLWHYSRHPNYFGEITLWIGVYLFTLNALSGIDIVIGALGPIYIASLIIFVSGIPKLEAYADNRWGNNAEYQRYKKNTSILIPFLKG